MSTVSGDGLTAAFWEILTQNHQLSCFQAPDPQKLLGNKCLLPHVTKLWGKLWNATIGSWYAYVYLSDLTLPMLPQYLPACWV